MDNDELKARSIELAERAFRLRDRATDTDTKEKLHATGNELIQVDNRQRFYDAQRILERGDVWTEDQRTLAHEINVADRQLRGGVTLTIEQALKYVEQWVEAAKKVTVDQDVTTEPLEEHFRTLLVSNDEIRRKNAIGYLLSYAEDILQYAHVNDHPENEMTDPAVLAVRDIRDSLLVHRELLFDEEDLVEKFKNEGQAIDRLGLARHQVEELYKSQ